LGSIDLGIDFRLGFEFRFAQSLGRIDCIGYNSVQGERIRGRMSRFLVQNGGHSIIRIREVFYIRVFVFDASGDRASGDSLVRWIRGFHIWIQIQIGIKSGGESGVFIPVLAHSLVLVLVLVLVFVVVVLAVTVALVLVIVKWTADKIR
jgi:hypothetical protein